MIEIPNFTIDKEIGHGGMATVYLAVQDMLDRQVALKVLLPDMMKDENLRKSFLSEGQIIASLEHPNIVRIHDIGINNETTFFMSMEYLSGGTLKDKMKDGKIPFAEAKYILSEIAQGLSYAHKKGYIHRDIKPGNILFRQNGSAVITDFGIAKLQDSSGELTKLGFTLGTVQYMSPEQATTTDLDSRSDIYSLGLVFFEMLMGYKAFKAESNIQAIHQHTTVAPPQLPQEYAYLQEVMDKVLSKSPDSRYQTVAEFVDAVNNPPPIIKKASVNTDSIQDDKTVIHSVKDFQIEEPTKKDLSKEPASKKKGFLVPGLIAGIGLLAAVTFGIMNNSSDTDSLENNVNTEPQKDEEVALISNQIEIDKQEALKKEQKIQTQKLSEIKIAETKIKEQALIKERQQQELIALEKEQEKHKEEELKQQQAKALEIKLAEEKKAKQLEDEIKLIKERQKQDLIAQQKEQDKREAEELQKQQDEALEARLAEEKKLKQLALEQKQAEAESLKQKELEEKYQAELKKQKEELEKERLQTEQKRIAEEKKQREEAELAQKKAADEEEKRKVALERAFAVKMPIEALNAHNRVRALDGQKPFVWSSDLAQISQEWADKLASTCEVYHHPGEQLPFGESLFYKKESTSVDEAVNKWASEKKFYNYQENKCESGKVCGHYTQIVWKGTTDVGCGVQSCSNGAQIWVCNYFPAGNYIGARPF